MKIRPLLPLVIFTLLAISFTSCDDDDYYDYYDQLPYEANNFIRQYYYYDDVIDIDIEGYGTATTYEVDFASGAQVYFDYYGNWYYVEAGWGDVIPSGIAPYNIENYVYNYFYPYGINSIYIRNWGYAVTLTDGTSLRFDNAGYPF